MLYGMRFAVRSLCIAWAITALPAAGQQAEKQNQSENQNQKSLEQRVQRLEAEIEQLKAQLAGLQQAVGTASAEGKERWVREILRLTDHRVMAFGLGPQIVQLEPQQGLDIAQAAWPKIQSRDVKTGLLKAFHFSAPLRPSKHRHVLQVLDMGMNDSDEEVRRYAAVYVSEYAQQDFSEDPQGYADWYQKHGKTPPDQLFQESTATPPVAEQPEPREDPLADVADVPSRDRQVEGQEKMRYFLIGAREGVDPPENGYRLVVIMPGGDGSAEFNPFIRRIFKHALGDSYLVAQPVAVKWTADQVIVWPTDKNRVEGQQFSTEQFVDAVVEDVARQYEINRSKVFSLSWSSSGPAAYACSLAEDTPVKGSYVTMSVFKPDDLPSLDAAKGHAYYIEHSPDDRICPIRMARQAEQLLREHGAAVTFHEYEGGHGWRGNVYDRLRRGFAWLDEQTVAGR